MAWQEVGHDIWIVSGPQPSVDADIVLVHVNRTVVPDDHIAFARRFPLVLNGRVLDISKRRVSRNLVQRDDDYVGPVIVKTDRNHGGTPEARMEARSSPVQWYVQSQQASLPWWRRTVLSPSEYRVFAAKAEVPDPVWENAALVVEKLLTEMHDGYCALRTWVFCGDQDMSTVGYSPNPMVRAADVVRREDNVEVPEDLRQLRREMGFDYGKFDYVIVDGHAALFDANRTPTVGTRSPEEYREWGRKLAQGLRALL
jgi:hypothetical protein